MADNQEEVVYQYTGDVSSLRQATESALSLLNKYQAQIDRISADGGFGKSAKAAKSFQSQLSATTKQITGMQKQMKGVSDVKLFPSNQVTQQLASSLGSIQGVLGKLSSSSKLSTKEVQALTAQIRVANQSLKSNSAAVDTLVQKEIRWQQTLDTVRSKTTQFRDSLDGFRSRIAGAFDPLLNKLKALSTPFTKTTTRMQSFRDKAAESFGKVSQLANTVASAFRRVSSSESASADATSKATNAHSRLRNILNSIQSAFKKETTALDTEKKALKSKNTELTESTKRHTSLRSVLSALGRAFSSESNSVKIFNTNLKGLSSSSKLVKSALTALTSIPIAQWLTSAAKQSINYAENLNLFTVALGDSVEQGTEFVNQMANIYGMDPSNLMRYAGNFYQLADAISMPDQAAANLSLGLTKAANDISSLFNVPIEQAFNDLSSGMQGMSRAVRKYGMDIRANTLQQTALSLGITENVESMSEANRQGLRYITMMRQAANASGDFSRTIESPANQLKIFREQIAQLGRAIGDLFITPLATAIAYINGFVMALRMIISFIGSILGLVGSITGGSKGLTKTTDGIADSIGGIGSAAGGAAKKLKAMLAPFDEINTLSKPEAGGGGGGGGGGLGDLGSLDPAIMAAIEEMQVKLEDVRMKALDVRDAILEFLGFKMEGDQIIGWDASILEENLINKFPQWTKTIQAIFSQWTSIIDAFGNVLRALGEVAQAVWENVTGFIARFINDDSVSSFIEGLADSLNSFASFLSTNADSVAKFVLILGALFKGFQLFTTISTLIAPVASFISTISAALAPFATMLNWIALVIAAIAVLYQSSTSFAASFDSLLGSVLGGLGSIFTALWELLQTIWVSIQTLWAENIQPMLEAVGEALAPVVRTIEEVWNNLASIVTSVIRTIEKLWKSTLEPVLASFFDYISNIARNFKVLWSDVIGPVLENIGDGFENVWENTLKPICENIIGIIGSLIDIVLSLWNDTLAPLTNWLITVLAPIVERVLNEVWEIVEAVISNIGQSINGLLEIIQGIIDFVAGVFTGDWSRAWKGVVSIFKGIWDTLAGVLKVPLNAVIGVINVALAAISGAINSIIRAVNSISFTVPSWIPGVGGKTIGFNLKQVGTWRIPYLENGGVVTSPTLAMVGEGKYDEAVIPLGNSPQMKELVNRISEATRGRAGDEAIQVNVYIGNEQVAEYMHKADRRMQLQTNGGI